MRRTCHSYGAALFAVVGMKAPRSTKRELQACMRERAAQSTHTGSAPVVRQCVSPLGGVTSSPAGSADRLCTARSCPRPAWAAACGPRACHPATASQIGGEERWSSGAEGAGVCGRPQKYTFYQVRRSRHAGQSATALRPCCARLRFRCTDSCIVCCTPQHHPPRFRR